MQVILSIQVEISPLKVELLQLLALLWLLHQLLIDVSDAVLICFIVSFSKWDGHLCIGLMDGDVETLLYGVRGNVQDYFSQLTIHYSIIWLVILSTGHYQLRRL